MATSYSKTRDDLLVVTDELIKKFGDEYTIKLMKLDQGNDHLMFVGKMLVGATYTMVRRMPKDYENPEGIQRAIKEAKVKNIMKLVKDDPGRYSSPNAVVIALQTATPYARIEADPADKDMFYFKVNLNKTKEMLLNASIDKDGYIENEEEFYVGTLIDGHHRTAGLYAAGRLDFEVPITIYIDLPKKEIAYVFENINKYQDKPSPTHSLGMEVMSGTISGTREVANRISDLLESEDWSILKQRIKLLDAKRPNNYPKAYVSSPTFVNLVSKYVLDYLPDTFSTIKKASLLNDYFTAWSDVFDNAWKDTKNHVLVKSMGFQIMIRLFHVIYEKLSLSGEPSKKTFTVFLREILKDSKEFEIDGVKVPMDWNSKTFGSYSSGKGLNVITAELTRHITNEYYKKLNIK